MEIRHQNLSPRYLAQLKDEKNKAMNIFKNNHEEKYAKLESKADNIDTFDQEVISK